MMMTRSAWVGLALVAALVVPASAQTAHVYNTMLPGLMSGAYLPSAAYPVGAPEAIGPLPLPMTGALAPTPPIAGGIAIDEAGLRVFVTDGALIVTEFHSQYAPFAPGIPLPPPVPAPALLGGGPVSGLCYDGATGLLWMCDGFSFGPFLGAAPFPPAGPAMAFPIPLPAPLTGIGIEAATNTLWFVDFAGNVYHLTMAGVPIGPQPVAFVPSLLGLPMIGIDVNEANGPLTFPAPACSTQVNGFHVCVTDGSFIYSVFAAFPPIPTNGPMGLMSGGGMECANDFQITPGTVGCLGSGVVMLPGTRFPNFNGPGAFNGLALRGAPPATSGFLLADLCPLPGGALLSTGETLWINPLSPTYSMVPVLTNAVGNVNLPISWVPVPAGLQFSVQWAIQDALHPLGFCLSDLCTVTVGRP
ncbi:MAG: hypothetical protein KDB53_22130 [Planctomycetes bacterium]|nr:hypothetical protein [Planctomycetota bacterium]